MFKMFLFDPVDSLGIRLNNCEIRVLRRKTVPTVYSMLISGKNFGCSAVYTVGEDGGNHHAPPFGSLGFRLLQNAAFCFQRAFDLADLSSNLAMRFLIPFVFSY